MADIVASHLPLKLKDKQDILETADVKDRLNKVIDFINNEKEVLEIEKKSASASNVDGAYAEGILLARTNEGDSKRAWR